MRIRAALYRDLPAVRALLAAEGLPTQDIDAHLATLLVGTRQGRIVATGALEPLGGACLLRSIVVACDCRGRGWGRRMTRRLLGLARRLQMPDVYLLTTTEADHFSGSGFSAVPRSQAPELVRGTRQFSEFCPSGAVLMHRILDVPERGLADDRPIRRESL